MKKDILAKAMRLADKSTVKPHMVVVAAPRQLVKPTADIYSERLYARITPAEMRRLERVVGTKIPYSQLLRELLADYLDKHAHEKRGKKK
jgi:hypothetical protein